MQDFQVHPSFFGGSPVNGMTFVVFILNAGDSARFSPMKTPPKASDEPTFNTRSCYWLGGASHQLTESMA